MKSQKSLELSLRYATCGIKQYRSPLTVQARSISSHPEPRLREEGETKARNEEKNESPKPEEGAMSRRLAGMSEEAMLEGGKSARKNMQEAGFSEELKKQLEERIAASSFQSEHAQAFSIANMPASAGKGTRDIAAGTPWTGNESTHDTALRMLDDASKPIRVPFKPPQPGPIKLEPDLKPKRSSGERLAVARDRTLTYELSQDSGISEEERESMRKQLRERFTPSARAFTLQGLTSLANERIEDAIARGQFRNIPRGKGKNVERDPTAGSPYLDTTEYFMNRIMQKQEVTPEWIQKQQAVKLDIERFRSRLRNDWKRHAAMLIASQGGSLQTQIKRAKAYALAEARHGKPAQRREQRDKESRTQIDHEGRLTSDSTTESSSPADGAYYSEDILPENPDSNEPLPDLAPLRDPRYLATEREYHELKIKALNEQVRSYNLQAPRVSQRPYLNLQRELDMCYAEVAQSLPEEVHRRATERSHVSEYSPQRQEVGFQQMLGLGKPTRVYDEAASKGYGFKELWRDLFGRKQQRHDG